MFDIKIFKAFKDRNTSEDIFTVSIQLDERFYNLNVTEKEFDQILNRLNSIRENNDLK